MAVESANEIADSRRSASASKDEGTYSRAFRVITTSAADGPGVVLQASGIPRRGDYYVTSTTTDLSAKCKSLRVEQDGESRLVWIVTAEYSDSPEDNQQEDDDPRNHAAVISWGFRSITKIAERDVETEDAIVNSANDVFDPPPEVEAARPVLKISKNLPGFDPSLAFEYVNAVNSDFWFGGAAKHWRCVNISSTSETAKVNDEIITYWKTDFEFEYNPDSWKLKILDRGYRETTTAFGNIQVDKRNILDQRGQPITEPALLDGDGAVLDDTNEGGGATDPVFLEFDVYRAVSFSGLNLP